MPTRSPFAPRRSSPPPTALRSGPWSGMRDSPDPSTAAVDVAYLLQNVFVDVRGGSVLGRPGFTPYNTFVLATNCRGMHEFAKTDGTRLLVLAVGEWLIYFDLATGFDYSVKPGAHGVTWSDTSDVFFVEFAGLLVVSDGVNAPFTWDGATTFVTMSNCPPLFGQPELYYAKMFGIKAAERDTLVWSEEADPYTGYEAGGHNNAWTLRQTGKDPLYRLVGTNQALFFFRRNSIGSIRGAVTPDFTSAGTLDDVSLVDGTVSPRAVQVVGDKESGQVAVFFLDQEGRPRRLIVGGGIDGGLWADAASTVSGIPHSRLGECQVALHPQLNMVLFAVPAEGTAGLGQMLAFDAGTGRFAGVWNGWRFDYLGTALDLDGRPRLFHVKDDTLYMHGTPDGDVWQDVDAHALPAAIEHVVETGALGYDHALEKHWERVDLSLRLLEDVALQVSYTLPNGYESTPQALTVTADVGARFDEAIYDVDRWSGSAAVERHAAVGISTDARWLRVRVRHASGTERFGLLGVTATAVPLSTNPVTR